MCRRLFVALGILLVGSLWAVPLDLPEDDTPVPALPSESVAVGEANGGQDNGPLEDSVSQAFFEQEAAPKESEEIVVDLPAQLEVVQADANAPSLQMVREEIEAVSETQSPIVDPELDEVAPPVVETQGPVMAQTQPKQPSILASQSIDPQKLDAQMKAPKDIVIDEPLPKYDDAPTLEDSAKQVKSAQSESAKAAKKPVSKNVFLIDPKIVQAAQSLVDSVEPKAVKPHTKKALPIPGGRKIDDCLVAADYDLKVMLEANDELTDRFVFGGKPTGMGLFLAREPSQLILMVNHGLGPDDAALSPFANQSERISSDLLFSRTPMAYGGVTRHVFDRYSGKIIDQSLSLAGTPLNTAGCATPWGTFLSAAGQKPTQQRLFEVDVSYRGLGAPFWKDIEISFQSMVMDASSQIFYFSKEEPIGHLYRIRPSLQNHLSEDMPVEVLCIQRWPGADSRNVDDSALNMHIDGYYNIYWRAVASLANSVGMKPSTMKNTATQFGAIRGMAMSGSSMYFVVEGTGAAGLGQLFELKGDTLRLVKEFAEGEPTNPTAIASLKPGRVLVASQTPQGSKIYMLTATGEWKALLLTPSQVGAMVVDPLTGVVYISLPEEGQVVRLFHKSFGK